MGWTAWEVGALDIGGGGAMLEGGAMFVLFRAEATPARKRADAARENFIVVV